MNTVADPGSLQNLNDIVEPSAVAFWPPAPGWYVVLAVLAVLLLWATFRTLQSWRRNTYRREALRELATVGRQGGAPVAAIPRLLKRTALSAWPRSDVAELSGSDWHAFLDRAAGTDEFGGGGLGELLDRVAYAGDPATELKEGEFERLRRATETWIRKHRNEDEAP